MEFKVGDIVYFELRNEGDLKSTDGDVRRVEFAHTLIGRLEHVDETHVEVTRAEESDSPFTLKDLPEKYKPKVAPQSETGADIFRIRRENVLSIIGENIPQSELKFLTIVTTLVGQLIELSVFDQRGKKKSVFGRITRDETHESSVEIRAIGPVPKALSEFARLEKGQKILSVDLNDNQFTWRNVHISEADRSNLKHYQKTFLFALESVSSSLKNFRRERVSSVAPGNDEKAFTGFTYDNSFFSEMDHIENELVTIPGPRFLSTFGEEIGSVGTPGSKSVIYGEVYIPSSNLRNKHGRDKLIWFEASRYPGLDAFLGFLKGGLARDKATLDRTRDAEGKRTVFTDILEGYFNPRASNKAFSWFKAEHLWMYTL